MGFKRSGLVVLLLTFTSMAWAMGNLSHVQTKSPLIGKSAPDTVLPISDGSSLNLVASRNGEKEILVFWATWCPHCYGELGTISDNLMNFERKGIKISLVDIGESREDVANYFLKRRMKLTSFIDGDSVLPEKYHLIGVPTIVFIDKNGIVCDVTHALPVDYEKYFKVR